MLVCSFARPLTVRTVIGARCMSTVLRPYRFHVGASWAGKPPEPSRTRRRRKDASANLQGFPADSEIGRWRGDLLSRFAFGAKGRQLGEDAFYVSDMRNQSGISLGVADGVGGWVESGVDPAVFSQALVYNAHQAAVNAWAGEPERDPTVEGDTVAGVERLPRQILAEAYAGVLRDPNVSAGSSTGCIVHLNASSGALRATNLGDSGFAILRSSAVVYEQQPQTHYFNCPKQLSKYPAGPWDTSGAIQDLPHHADQFETRLRDGDTVILFTDGCSDNVFSEELAQIAALTSRTVENEDEQAQAMADNIVEYARITMRNQTRVSPFEKGARRAGQVWRGGKIDDVTVIVAIVRETM